MKYKAQLVLHVVNILLFKKCLLWTHLNLRRKHLEVIKCICACPDWLWERSGKGVSGVTENKGRGWRLDTRCLWPCSVKSAHIFHYAISASIQHGSSLRKCTQRTRINNVQAEGGRHIELMGHDRCLWTPAKNCSDILASISESQRKMQSCSAAKQSAEQHLKNN